MLDRAGEWWIGTRNGLYRFPRVEKFEELAKISPTGRLSRESGLPFDNIK